MKSRWLLLLLAGVMGNGCTQNSLRMNRAVIGQGLGVSKVTLEGSIADFEREAGVIVVGGDWEKVKLGVWRWSGDTGELADMLGGYVDGDSVILARRRDGCYLLEVFYGVASISTGDSRLLSFEVWGLVASAIVDNGDEFDWRQTTEERLPLTSIVSESGAQIGTGFEVIKSGTEISEALFDTFVRLIVTKC